jgi:hypothetical protein
MRNPEETSTSQSPHLSRSVSFWIALFAALCLYGIAVLSPKLANREQLLTKYQAQRVQMLRDEQKLTRLRHATVSMQQDSRFVEKILQRDLPSNSNGDEEIIPLEGPLVYRENHGGEQGGPVLSIRHPPWYAPVLTTIGRSSDIRGVLLLSSVVLILFAFGFLQLPESSSDDPDRTGAAEISGKPALMKKWLSRYDRSDDEAERKKLLERLARMESDADWEKDALPIISFEDEKE